MPVLDTEGLSGLFNKFYDKVSPYLPSEGDVNAVLDAYDQATKGVPNPLQFLDESVRLPLVALTAFKSHGIPAKIARKSKLTRLHERRQELEFMDDAAQSFKEADRARELYEPIKKAVNNPRYKDLQKIAQEESITSITNYWKSNGVTDDDIRKGINSILTDDKSTDAPKSIRKLMDRAKTYDDKGNPQWDFEQIKRSSDFIDNLKSTAPNINTKLQKTIESLPKRVLNPKTLGTTQGIANIISKLPQIETPKLDRREFLGALGGLFARGPQPLATKDMGYMDILKEILPGKTFKNTVWKLPGKNVPMLEIDGPQLGWSNEYPKTLGDLYKTINKVLQYEGEDVTSAAYDATVAISKNPYINLKQHLIPPTKQIESNIKNIDRLIDLDLYHNYISNRPPGNIKDVEEYTRDLITHLPTASGRNKARSMWR
jgi:hypothetical protein